MKKNIDEAKLRKLYLKDGLSCERIAPLISLSKSAITKRLVVMGITIRTPAESRKITYRKGLWKHPPGQRRKNLDSDLIAARYKEGVPISILASELHVSTKAIENNLKCSGSYEVGRGHNLIKGSRHWNWKGGKRLIGGYIYIYTPTHPRATQRHAVAEHTLVWEKENGKYLPEGWEVHHFNGIKTDNRPENLMGLSSKKHRLIISVFQLKILDMENEIKQLKETKIWD